MSLKSINQLLLLSKTFRDIKNQVLGEGSSAAPMKFELILSRTIKLMFRMIPFNVVNVQVSNLLLQGQPGAAGCQARAAAGQYNEVKAHMGQEIQVVDVNPESRAAMVSVM